MPGRAAASTAPPLATPASHPRRSVWPDERAATKATAPRAAPTAASAVTAEASSVSRSRPMVGAISTKMKTPTMAVTRAPRLSRPSGPISSAATSETAAATRPRARTTCGTLPEADGPWSATMPAAAASEPAAAASKTRARAPVPRSAVAMARSAARPPARATAAQAAGAIQLVASEGSVPSCSGPNSRRVTRDRGGNASQASRRATRTGFGGVARWVNGHPMVRGCTSESVVRSRGTTIVRTGCAVDRGGARCWVYSPP